MEFSTKSTLFFFGGPVDEVDPTVSAYKIAKVQYTRGWITQVVIRHFFYGDEYTVDIIRDSNDRILRVHLYDRDNNKVMWVAVRDENDDIDSWTVTNTGLRLPIGIMQIGYNFIVY